MEACNEIGEAKDTSAVKLLLTHSLDPSSTTNWHYKGMTANYVRLGALEKISGLKPPNDSRPFEVNTINTKFYLNWALKNKLIKSEDEINLNSY